MPRGLQYLTLSMVAMAPHARLVHLQMANLGEEPFRVGVSERQATHYVVKVEFGGVAGLVAPLVGKQPPDSRVWIPHGGVPAFVRTLALSLEPQHELRPKREPSELGFHGCTRRCARSSEPSSALTA